MSGAVIEVVKVGAVPNTATPLPVSSVNELSKNAEVAVVVACEAEPRKRAREAVSEVRVMVLPVRVGLVSKTATPVPVSLVRALERLAEVSPPASRLATPLA